MKIDSFNISTNSQHSLQRIEFEENRYTLFQSPGMNDAAKPDADSDGYTADISSQAKQPESNPESNSDNSNSDIAKSMQENTRKALNFQAVKASKVPDFAASVQDTKIKLLEQMIYALTGKRFKFSMVNLAEKSGGNNTGRAEQMMNAIALSSNGDTRRTQSYYLESEHFLSESETMDYSAQGNIRTADGRTITVDVNLHMSRSYMSYDRTSEEIMKNCVDPLVINYAGDAASLTGETFDFDLDLDGSADKIHFAGAGSGFLALDKNGDGIINDGSELFGPNTGSGFGELRMYDSDGNGWIDENDEIFDKLKVWSKDKDGNDQLFSLKEVNVGAIYLGDTKTQFSMNDSANNTMGAVRSTSFFLKESGGAGTINHIDLAL